MCGIVGMIGSVIDTEKLAAASQLLALRGPDTDGMWLEHDVGLANRRLSIIDISNAGRQPMVSGDGRYVIVFNGEIYNYLELRALLDDFGFKWRSSSDTEVVLNSYLKWGLDCLPRFDGMFAFAIWDRKARTLFAARDRLGVKPLYYARKGNCFVFASRPRALLALIPELGRSIDTQGLRYYVDVGYFPGPYSIFKDIRRLPAGHYLVLDGLTQTIERYWTPCMARPEATWERRSEEDLLDELEAIVTRSVRSRLVSDVPVGAFLSGGIDSSLVVAMMSRFSSSPVSTFTIGFTEPEYDESRHAAEVASHLGTRHHSEQMKVDDLLELMPTFSREFDEPFFDSSAFPTMAVSRLARRYVSVSLGGDGGDELFGGYHYYRIVAALTPLYELTPAIRNILASWVGLLPSHKASLLATAINQKNRQDVFPFIRSISKNFPSVLHPEVHAKTQGIVELFRDTCNHDLRDLQPADQAMRLDMLYTLPDDYLQKLDVASMAFSLEARDPLLSRELVEWALRLPLCWKIRMFESKYLLRRLARRYLRPELLKHPKKGFEVPIDRWLRGPLREWARERLHDNESFHRVPINQARVQFLFEQHCRGQRNASPILWAVLMLIDFVRLNH